MCSSAMSAMSALAMMDMRALFSSLVMAGLVPAISIENTPPKRDRRVKPGDDEELSSVRPNERRPLPRDRLSSALEYRERPRDFGDRLLARLRVEDDHVGRMADRKPII